MTYDEIKNVLARLEKFRQVVQNCAAEGDLMVTVDSQDHLLREAILCIEELDQKARQEPQRYYCSTGDGYYSTPDHFSAYMAEEARRAMEIPTFKIGTLPNGMGFGDVKYYKSYSTFDELAKATQDIAAENRRLDEEIKQAKQYKQYNAFKYRCDDPLPYYSKP